MATDPAGLWPAELAQAVGQSVLSSIDAYCHGAFWDLIQSQSQRSPQPTLEARLDEAHVSSVRRSPRKHQGTKEKDSIDSILVRYNGQLIKYKINVKAFDRK